jgi:hypothetical protein
MATGWMVADQVLVQQLQRWLSGFRSGTTWYVQLFQNNYVPQPGDVVGNYVSATFPGYQAVQIDAGQWGPVQSVNHTALSIHPTTCTWIPTPGEGGQLIYGYFVISSLGAILFAESFDSPVYMGFGSKLQMQPVLRNGNLPPSCI